MYIFSSKFLDDLAARITGPMSFRFFVQPMVAIMLGIRDGKLDSKAGTPPFLYNVIFKKENYRSQLRNALHALLKPVIVGIVLDALAQYLIFKHIRPLPALLVGTFIMGVPYSLSRGISNRIFSKIRTKKETFHDKP